MTNDVWSLVLNGFQNQANDRWPTLAALASHLDPDMVQTPALDLIDAALQELLNTPDGRLIISMPPQEGKSRRVARDFPVDTLMRRPNTRIVTASYGQSLANRNGRAIRNIISTHPELGLRIAADNGAVSDWTLMSQSGAPLDGGVLSVGIGAGLTGRPADLLIIDDPIKDRKEADSEVYRDSVWDWWTDAASTRLAPGAPVVLILTRWHQDDLAGRLTSAEDGHLWKVLNIPAEAFQEDDPLGRAPGVFMESARRRTTEQWEAIKIRVGSRTWASLYQGTPSAVEGDTFKRTWWKQYDEPLWVTRPDGAHIVTGDFDMLLQSWDLTFSDSKKSDYVVGQVWLKRAGTFYLLDQVRGRWAFPEQVRQFEALSAKWPQAILKLVENKANGPALISSLSKRVPGIVGEEPRGSKEVRAAAVTPFVEAGNAYLPSPALAPWVGAFVEELAAFPNGVNDDQVDCVTQALNRFAVMVLHDDFVTEPEDDYAELRGWSISPL